MKKLITSPVDLEIERESKPYFSGKAGIYPGILYLVMSDFEMKDIRDKLLQKEQLNEEEQTILIDRYLGAQKHYQNICSVLASWAGVYSQFLFLDSLNTDIAPAIYNLRFDILNTDSRTKEKKLAFVLQILKMTENDLLKYKISQPNPQWD